MAFLWSMHSGQYEDLDGAAERVLLADAADAPLHRTGWKADKAKPESLKARECVGNQQQKSNLGSRL